MKGTKGVDGRRVNVALNGELLELMECFNYLGSKITVDGEIETEVKSSTKDVGKVFSCTAMGMNVKRKLYEAIAVPTALSGLKHGVWQ